MLIEIEISEEMLALDFVEIKELIFGQIMADLLDKIVENPYLQGIQIRFSKNGLKHGTYRNSTKEKLLLVSHLPNLIASASIVRKEAQRKDKNRQAFILEIRISLNGEQKKYRIVLKENPNGTFYYDHYEWLE
jgi:Large polyvalent protein-associated domain 3